VTGERATYQRLEEAIREVAALEGAEGIPTDWIVVAAFQRYEGAEHRTQILRLLPPNDPPYHRIMGLLDYAKALYRHEITEDQ
jgi:hypothetical protein